MAEIGRVSAAGAAAAVQGAAAHDSPEAVRKAARGLEAALLRELMSAMQKAQLEGGGFFAQDGGFAAHQTTFELYLSDAMAERGPLGLADKIAEQLTKKQAAVSSVADSQSSPRTFDLVQKDSVFFLDTTPQRFIDFRSEAQVNAAAAEKRGGQLYATRPPRSEGRAGPEDER